MSISEKLVRCFWLLLLIYIGSNQMLKAQDTAHVFLTNYEAIDVCGNPNEKECTISISIGEVKPEDDFYGFTFEARYNREKFIFNQPLYINTLAQFFDFDKRNVAFLDSGLIRGYAGTFSGTRVYGNMPLIAFKGRYLGQCPDTSYIRIEWLEFTDEFKRTVDYSDKYVLVSAEVQDKPGRSITASFKSDTIDFSKSDSTGIVIATLMVGNSKQLQNIEFELVTDDKENFRIEDVKSITEKLRIDSLIPIENGKRIYTTTFDDIDGDSVFEIRIKELKREGEVKELKLTPLKVNDCSCIVNLIEGKTIIKANLEDTTGTGISEIENKAINGYYNEIKDKFIIETEKGIREINIYNMMGILIKKINLSDIDRIAEIPAEEFIKGLYLITVKNMENEINRIVMIKN